MSGGVDSSAGQETVSGVLRSLLKNCREPFAEPLDWGLKVTRNEASCWGSSSNFAGGAEIVRTLIR